MRVYLDQTRLEDAQRWNSGFMEDVAYSWVIVPIVSVGPVGPMVQLGEHDEWTDKSVLLEWAAALERTSGVAGGGVTGSGREERLLRGCVGRRRDAGATDVALGGNDGKAGCAPC